MPPTRPRRIVRRAVMALAAVVLLPVGYFGSMATLVFLHQMGLVPPAFDNIGAALVQPLAWYVNDSGLPGSELCNEYLQRIAELGRSLR